MTDDVDPVTDALRASLARHAGEAPNGDPLAERIVATVRRAPAAPPAGRNAWRTWTLPLIAAAAVAAVVLAVVGIENYHPAADNAPVAGVSGSAPTGSAPTGSAPTTSATESATTAASSRTPSPSSTRPVEGADLTAVRVLDVTFVGEDDGFALASARCLRGSGRCTALLRTTDGTSWHSMAGPRFNVAGVRGCAAPCVSHLRFANDQTGYAFGPHALLMTTDGGRSWVQQKGTGATALESLNGNVIRVFSTTKGCPPACTMQVGTAANGSRRWVTATLPGATLADGVQLARSGSAAYVLLTRNPAAGAGRQTSALYRSRDDGRTWTPLGEPCPQAGGETDSLAVSAGAGQRAAVLCATRQPQRCFVVTSTDAGASWTTRPMTVPAATAGVLTGDPATVLVSAGSGVAFSTDGGRRWSVVPDITGNVTFIGFESTSVGRVVADGGRTIWTTRDAGASWREVALP